MGSRSVGLPNVAVIDPLHGNRLPRRSTVACTASASPRISPEPSSSPWHSIQSNQQALITRRVDHHDWQLTQLDKSPAYNIAVDIGYVVTDRSLFNQGSSCWKLLGNGRGRRLAFRRMALRERLWNGRPQ